MITPLFIVLLAFLLRLPLLNGSFWLDEAAQALESIRPLSAQLQIVDDFQPPLFHLVVHFFSLISRQEWWLRLPSLIAGVATVALVYCILHERFGKKAAVIGSLLLATSPFHIFYSQELRPYALATFLATASWFLLVTKRTRAWKMPLFTLTSILGMYTMYLYPLNILAQLVYLLREKKYTVSKTIAICSVLIVSFLPWLPTFLLQLQAGTTLTQTLPGWSLAVATPQLKAVPLIFAKFFVGQVPFRNNLLFMIGTAVALILVCVELVRNARNLKARVFGYWFLIPILAAWLISFFIPVIQAKRVLFILPALYAMLSVGKGKFSQIVIAIVVLLQLFSLGWYFIDNRIQREDWRTLISTIEEVAPPDSVAFFSFPEPFAPWRWYAQSSVRPVATGKLNITEIRDISSVSSQLDSVSMVYLFDYLRDLTDPNDTTIAFLESQGFEQIKSIDGKQVGFVRIFKKR